MHAPTPCGPLSRAVHDHLTHGTVGSSAVVDPGGPHDPTTRDHALALWMLYELAYRGFDDVDDAMEWDPAALTLRARLEADLESWLRSAWESWDGPRDLAGLVEHDAGTPGVAAHVRHDADADEVRDVLVQRSVYHLKEADPHCFVLPRLEPAAKAALMELQFDELGDGDPLRVHQHLFAQALEAAGLDPAYGAYVDAATEETLTLSNVLSFLCLHRRLRHAALGHLALFEATSALPSADLVRGLRRLGFDERVVRYYDEHVEADAVHEHLARDLCTVATGGDPRLEDEVAFGAFCCWWTEERFAAAVVPREAAA